MVRLSANRGWTTAKALTAGILLAGSVPPWGWWPLAFGGIALLDHLLSTSTSWKQRFGRTWLCAAAWLYPAMLWMWDLTAPGYLVAGGFFAAYFGIAGALTPSSEKWRRLVLPGAIALAEFARWTWPFGGVPLAHLGLSQVNSPLVFAARLGGPLLIVVAVVVVGQALTAAISGRLHWALVGLGLTALAVTVGYLYPRADVVQTAEIALVQGGGPQQTRASSSQEPVVLGRHIEGSNAIEGDVDLVIWPENVINPGKYLRQDDAFQDVVEVAKNLDAEVLAGWFMPISETATANYHSVVTPDGEETDRYDKVQIVPFGEYVPLRGLVETLAPDAPLPLRDLQRGTLPPVLDTAVGPVGVSISWEGYFEHRARHSIREGAQLLTNPTNGSSYWLTQVQTQQVASNQLRAVENDRWVLQVAPTGLTAVIDPTGNVVQRTDVAERRTLQATVEMRRGRTPASRVGPWPVVGYGLLAVLAAIVGPAKLGAATRFRGQERSESARSSG